MKHFGYYLAACKLQGIESQPVHLHNNSQEKELLFTDMAILNLDVPSTMQIERVAERILYADADVVHLANTSVQRACFLYEVLSPTYSNFIHIPSRDRGVFIVSKYPLSNIEITLHEEANAAPEEVLEFAIHGANIYHASVFPNSFPMKLVNLKDNTTTPVLLIDVPGTLTIIKQRFSPFQSSQMVDLLPADMFQMIPIKHKGGGNNDDRGGYKGEIEVGRSWGGKDGGHWEGTARFEAYDSHGNYVEGEVKQNDKGEGSAKARAGHEDK